MCFSQSLYLSPTDLGEKWSENCSTVYFFPFFLFLFFRYSPLNPYLFFLTDGSADFPLAFCINLLCKKLFICESQEFQWERGNMIFLTALFKFSIIKIQYGNREYVPFISSPRRELEKCLKKMRQEWTYTYVACGENMGICCCDCYIFVLFVVNKSSQINVYYVQKQFQKQFQKINQSICIFLST